jgi:hypothetical protein
LAVVERGLDDERDRTTAAELNLLRAKATRIPR